MYFLIMTCPLEGCLMLQPGTSVHMNLCYSIGLELPLALTTGCHNRVVL